MNEIMSSVTIITFSGLILVQLITRVVFAMTKNGEDYRGKYLNTIDEFFYRTTVERGGNKIKYCVHNIDEGQKRSNNIILDLENIAGKYTHLPNVNAVTLNDANDPVTDYGVLYLNQADTIPLYIKADIRARHLHPAHTYTLNRDVENQMILMNKLESDDKGLLLAHSLGGKSSTVNIVPIARNVYRYADTLDNLLGISTTLGIPGPNFKSNEHWIQNFLSQNPVGRVTLILACQYRSNIFTDSRRHDYRPLRIAVQFTAYTNQNEITSVHSKTGPLSYLNNNNYGCEYKQSRRNYRRSSDDKYYANYIAKMHSLANSKCKPDHEIKSKGKLGEGDEKSAKFIVKMHCKKGPQCGLGEETVRQESGDETAEEVARGKPIPYRIGDKHFYYLSDGGDEWYTYQLYPNGTNSKCLSHGTWPEAFPVILTYDSNGRLFLYTCNNMTNDWMIRELFSSGNIGEILSNGTWDRKCQSSFHFATVNGKNYVYSQTSSANNQWWIQELLPGGKMGRETDHGVWNEDYQLVFPFQVKSVNFFLRHNHENKSWMTKELLPGGTMGKDLATGTFKVRFRIAFPFTVKGDRRHCFLAHSVVDGTEWFIYELLSNGKVGKEACKGDFGDRCPSAFQYQIEGQNFLYRRCMQLRYLYVQKLF